VRSRAGAAGISFLLLAAGCEARSECSDFDAAPHRGNRRKKTPAIASEL